MAGRTNWAFRVVQCDQTSPFATSMMLCSEEVRRPFQRPVSFLLQSEVQHVNHIDRSSGAVFARWRRLGILPVARLARLQDERRTMRLDPSSQSVLWGSHIETNSRTPRLHSALGYLPPAEFETQRAHPTDPPRGGRRTATFTMSLLRHGESFDPM